MMHQIHLRQARTEDIATVCSIENDCFTDDAFSENQFHRLLKSKNSFFILAEFQNIVSGYMILLQRKGSKHLRIYSIAVHSSARHLHIGSMLLQHAEYLAKHHNKSKITLEVSVNNHTAIEFYKNHGYKATSIIPDYYHDKSDAWKMEKMLP